MVLHRAGGQGSRLASGRALRARVFEDQHGERVTRKQRKAVEAALAEKVKPLTKVEQKKRQREQGEAMAIWRGWR